MWFILDSMILWDSVLKESYLHRKINEKELKLWLNYYEKRMKIVNHILDMHKGADEEYRCLKSEIDGLEKDVNVVKGKAMSHLIGSSFPSSESVVTFAFGRIYKELEPRLARVLLGEDRFDKITFRTQYPDAELIRGDKATRIEFELHSRDFKTHSHDEKKCDLIICWVHDWKDCSLKVFELRSLSMYEPKESSG